VKHSLECMGYGIRLRPVESTDAEFILRLRNLPHVSGTVGDTVPDAGAQRQWIQSSWDRPGDYYLLIETEQGMPIGTVGIYNVLNGVGEWGRWILLPGTTVALASAILTLDIAFYQLSLTEVCGCVVKTNSRIVSFHHKFGLRQTRIEQCARVIDGKWIDLVWFAMDAADWLSVRRQLHPLAEAGARAFSTGHLA